MAAAEPNATIPEDDSQARARIGPWSPDEVPELTAFEPDTNFVVRASAGSGKTTALVGRMTALVRSGVPVDELTAITFTRKAAGEMSTRFLAELRATREALDPSSAEWRRVDRATRRVQRAFIGTIHAFCARLLRERPLAAGLPPDFSAGLEAREERRLRKQAWQEHLQEMQASNAEAIDRITAVGIEPHELTTYFATLCRHPELTPYVAGPTAPPALDAAVDAATERLHQWMEHRPNTLPEGRDAVMEAFDRAAQMLRFRALDTSLQKAEFLKCFTDVSDGEKAKVTLKCWRGDEIDSYDWARSLRDEYLPALVRETLRPALRAWDAYVHRVVVEFTQPAVARYRRQRQEEGMLTFHDLLMATRDLLRDYPTVRRRIQERYPRLLVDEFQDTDPLQAQILAFLASDDPEETDWRACAPRDGSLFIVGDDKQSIYRFRRADMSVFDDYRRRIDAAPNGEAVDLTKNFRSRAPICDWCDAAFTSIFSTSELEDLQAEYVPFDPQRPAGRPNTALRRITLDKVKWNRGQAIAQQDATAIARFIRAACDGTAPPALYGAEGVFEDDAASYADFLILTRTKSRLDAYAAALAERDIPYTVTGSEDLGETEALKTLLDLLTAAYRPDDSVAAVAYLKGRAAGCSDADLYHFVEAGGALDALHEPIAGECWAALETERAQRIRSAIARLRDVRALVQSVRPGVGIERVVDEQGLLAGAVHPLSEREGARDDASRRAGAMLRILSYVQQMSAQGLGWGGVIEELQRVWDGEEALDGLTLETGASEAVRIMNVHQAKGLQAPVVFLADPYSSGSAPDPRYHLRRDADELVAPIVQGEDYYTRVTHAPLGWHEDTDEAFVAEEKRHQAAEEHRLLYVAATRAARMLVVSTYPAKPDAGPWAPLYPHLEQADVSELHVPDDPPAARTAREAPAPDLEAYKQRRRDRIAERAQPSMHIETVTDEKGGGLDRLDAAGYGAAVGRVVHHYLELLIRHRTQPPTLDGAAVRERLRHEGGDEAAEHGPQVQAMVERFKQSALWTDLHQAAAVRTECPVAQMNRSTLTRGTIDLAYQTDAGWTLVDFKSDRVETSQPLETLLPDDHPYREQIRTYAALWATTGRPVQQAGLWFADVGAFVDVEGATG